MKVELAYVIGAASVIIIAIAVRGVRDLRVLSKRIEEIATHNCASWNTRFPSMQIAKKAFWRLESLRHRLDFLESNHTFDNGLRSHALPHASRDESLENIIDCFAKNLSEGFFAASYFFVYRKVSTTHWQVGAETIGNPALLRTILSSVEPRQNHESALPALYGYSSSLQKSFTWDEGAEYEGVVWLGYPESQPPLKGSEKLLSVKISQFTSDAQNRHRVQLLSEQIETQGEELKGKSDFLNHISHDLRTPLGNIRTVLQLFQLEGMKDDAPELLQCALKNCDKVTSLLEDIISFAEFQNGKLQPLSTDFSLDELLEEILLIHQPLARAKNLSLSNISTGLKNSIPLHSDRQHLFRILSNLVENAIKYTERGSVTISLQEELAATNIYVRDTGSGISVNDFSRIFAPFERSHQNSRGAGLGLTICKNLADLHGYTIRVESNPSEGSTFILSIPRIHFNKVSSAPIILKEDIEELNLTTAVFHSHPQTSRNIVRCLEAYGIETLRCDSEVSLFEQLQTKRVSHLVLEDMGITPATTVKLKDFTSRNPLSEVILLASGNSAAPKTLHDRFRYLSCSNSFEQIAAIILSKSEEPLVKKLA